IAYKIKVPFHGNFELRPLGVAMGNLEDAVSRSLLREPWVPQTCHCEKRRTVCLKTPGETCQTASDVLVKTVHFMKSLPAFQQLPPKDQLSLLQNCWAPLFILGLAQDRVLFEVHDSPAPSMLKRILLNGRETPSSDPEQPTLRACLKKFWSLDLSPKEYAYLKGTVIFNPGTVSKTNMV
uniref:Nuclear receptor subfamily 0, group B, member 2a n=1 Tax=Sinocyclocheilus grahami TaxID=75366 RepID=A0A672KQJ9_SINGR